MRDEVFSQRFDPMLLQEIFQTPFFKNHNKKKRKTCMPETRTLRKQVVAEYLNYGSGRLLL